MFSCAADPFPTRRISRRKNTGSGCARHDRMYRPAKEEPTPTPASLAEARHSAPSRYQQSVWHPLVGVQNRSLFLCGWTYLLTWRRQTLQPSRSLFYLYHSSVPIIPEYRILPFGSKRLPQGIQTSPFVRPAKQSQATPVPCLPHVRDVSTGERSVAR